MTEESHVAGKNDGSGEVLRPESRALPTRNFLLSPCSVHGAKPATLQHLVRKVERKIKNGFVAGLELLSISRILTA